MTISQKYVLTLICLIAISFIYGCASDLPNPSPPHNSNALPSNPVKPLSLDEQLLDVAGEPPFREEPDDPVAALSLVKAGANVNTRDSASVPVLSIAIRNGRIKMAKLLLEHGADVNAQSNNGDTALMLAVGVDDLRLVKLLLDYKANVNMKNKDGFTALSGSEMVGGSNEPDYVEVRRILKKAGAK